MPASRSWIIGAVLFLIVLNVVALWWFQLVQKKEYQALQQTVSQRSSASPPPSPSSQTPVSSTPSAALEKSLAGLKAQLAQLVERVTTLEEAATTTQETPPSTTQVIYVSPSPSSATKESVVFLGSGSTFSRDWTEISATAFTFEPSNYPKIKSLTFEAGTSIQGGEVRARLKNKTKGVSLVETEVMHNTGTSTWKSASFTAPTTGTTYVVELISSSGERANLDGARLKIVTY